MSVTAMKSPSEVMQELTKALPRHYCDKLVGKRIAERRGKLGLSQRDIAFPGCSYAYISRLEAGLRRPSLSVMLKLSLLLDVSPEYLAWGRGSKRLGSRMQRYVLLLLGVKTTELELANARKRAVTQFPK